MKRNIRYVFVSLILVFCLGIAGCGGKKDQGGNQENADSNALEIYYPSGNVIVTVSERYQLKQPDSVQGAIEELMTQSLEAFDGKLLNYSYMLDESNTATFELTMAAGYTREYGVLTMAALSNTLFQVEDIEGVKLILLTETGEELDAKLILRNTFYFYGYEDVDAGTRVTLYKPDDSGSRLSAESKAISTGGNTSVVEAIVIALLDMGVLPEGTVVNSVTVNGEICYIDLSSEFENGVFGIKSDTVLYALVNSITSLSYVNSVQITIDGEIKENYRGTVYIGEPLSFNKDILE